MKIIIVALLYLILNCSLLQFINGFEIVFLNLIPFGNSDCTGIAIGNGYSTIIDTCVTFDYRRNYVFTVRKSQNTVSWNQFESLNGEQVCNEPTSPIEKVSLNSCIPFSQVGNLDINVNASESASKSTWYKVSISSDSPVIPLNSYTVSMSSGQCTVDSPNALLYSYFTNGTLIPSIYSGNTLFYCENNIPYSIPDYPNQQPSNMAKVCSLWAPFFNSSYEVFPPSTGCYTGSGSGGGANSGSSGNIVDSTSCNSGATGATGSYSNSFSSQSGGTGSGSNSDSDSNNEGVKENVSIGGSGSEAASYQSCYCT